MVRWQVFLDYLTTDPIATQAIDMWQKTQAALGAKHPPSDSDLHSALHFLRRSTAAIETVRWQAFLDYLTIDPIATQAIDMWQKTRAALGAKHPPSDSDLHSALHFLRRSTAAIEDELRRRGNL